VHTGDISNSKSLEKFSNLNCKLFGVFGNNDVGEPNLKEVAKDNLFFFRDPPLQISKHNKNIVIFHEPDSIDEFLSEHKDIDIVLHGHTHRYREEKRNNVLIFNPGESAGIIKGQNVIGLINLEDLFVERIWF